MAASTVRVTVTQVTPTLRVAVPGDPAGVDIPANNTSGFALSVGNDVRLRVLPSGGIPEVTGRAT